MKSIREVLRLLLMGKRYSAYWRSLHEAEMKRHGYGPAVNKKGRRQNQDRTNGRA